jgi:hypothetical protein
MIIREKVESSWRFVAKGLQRSWKMHPRILDLGIIVDLCDMAKTNISQAFS